MADHAPLASDDRSIPKGFDCHQCGKHHEFCAYVSAHWDVMLIHTCDGCGQQHHVRQGIVTRTYEVEPKFDVGVYP